MKSIFTKKVLIIVSIVAFIAITAIVVAFATGNSSYPELTDPDGVFYQRLDDDGNVVYSITNEELFEEIKSNDGIQQLLFYTDSILLAEYLDTIDDTEIDNKILELTYGTSDQDEIAKFDADDVADAIAAYEQTMKLGGYYGNEEAYAALLIAREEFTYDYADDNDYITEYDVVYDYLNSYFEDITAINIRFTSEADAEDVMQKCNLLQLAGLELRTFNGYDFKDGTLLDDEDVIIDAYKTVVVYYFDDDENILDIDGKTVYTKGTGNIYTDADDVEYTLEEATGNLIVQEDSEIAVASNVLFDTKANAETYKDANTFYYSISKIDAFDNTEVAAVKDETDAVVYTIKADGHLYDLTDTDVTETSGIIINKFYTTIDEVDTVNTWNSSEMTDEIALGKYIEMYNYVYGEYRDLLDVNSTDANLVALDNDFLTFNFDDTTKISAAISSYLFTELGLYDDGQDRYSQTPESIGDYYYLMYKVTEPTKINVLDSVYSYLEPLVEIPTVIAGDITLPTTTYYEGTIAWSSKNSDLITSTGVVTNPTVDTDVVLTFTISVLGDTRSFDKTVTILAEGTTEEVTKTEWTEVSLKGILDNDTVYDMIYDELITTYVDHNNNENVETVLEIARAELGFKIYDKYLGMDYQSLDATFKYDEKGDSNLICSFDKTLTSEDGFTVSADQLFEYALTKNPSLYTLYASLDKELLYSKYFTNIFGDELNIRDNKSERMDEMYTAISNSKSEYSYYQSLYANMGSSFGYDSWADFAYARYGTKTEYALLQYFVTQELQAYLINEVTDKFDVIEELYTSMEEYYNNYFSLNVEQLLIFIDYDEDNTPDDYNEFIADMDAAEATEFSTLLASLYNKINDYEDSYSDLEKEFNEATRDDETWGEYKQYGLFMLTESLNKVDDDSVSHSLTYSGEYGVKDSFVPEFVDALVDLYQDYQIPQNLEKDELSDTVVTEFGFHFIKVGQGDDFEKPSAAFEEEDSDNPVYSVGIENDQEIPSSEQLELYALYQFYAMVYDLSDADVEEKYGLESIPNIPTTVKDALDTYFDELLSGVYVIGTVNVAMIERINGANGTFLDSSYTDISSADLLSGLDMIYDVYFEAILGDYIPNN